MRDSLCNNLDHFIEILTGQLHAQDFVLHADNKRVYIASEFVIKKTKKDQVEGPTIISENAFIASGIHKIMMDFCYIDEKKGGNLWLCAERATKPLYRSDKKGTFDLLKDSELKPAKSKPKGDTKPQSVIIKKEPKIKKEGEGSKKSNRTVRPYNLYVVYSPN